MSAGEIGYTPQYKAKRRLRAALEGRKLERSPAPAPKGNPNGGNGHGKANATTFWRLYNERGRVCGT